MAGLADRRILGSRSADGRVYAPPFEFDPVTFDPPDDLVPVGPEGTVTTWSWAPQPLEGQPLTHPFAWALIRLDGADTAMLHAVDAGPAAVGRAPGRGHPRHRLLCARDRYPGTGQGHGRRGRPAGAGGDDDGT